MKEAPLQNWCVIDRSVYRFRWWCLTAYCLFLCRCVFSVIFFTRKLVRTRFSIYRSQRSATSFSLNQLIVLTLFRCKKKINKIANNFLAFFLFQCGFYTLGARTLTPNKNYTNQTKNNNNSNLRL